MSFSVFFIALIAMGLDWLSSRPVPFLTIPHPVRALGYFTEFFERTLNRSELNPAAKKRRGGLLVTAATAMAYGAGWLIDSVEGGAGAILQVWVAATMLSQRELAYRVKRVAEALEQNRQGSARRRLRHIVGRKTEELDRHKLAAAALESLAENFADGVVAPIFWYLAGGMPMLLVSKAANTLDSMIGYKNRRFRHFGMAAAHLDTLLNFIPARLAAAALALASGGKCAEAMRVAFKDGSNHSSLNAGWPEGAMAGALQLQLGGERRYPGRVVRDRPIGDGEAKIAAADCFRGIALYKRGCGVLALGVLALGLLALIALKNIG